MRSLLALTLALEGCFALGLDDFALPTCSNSAQCEPLNLAEGIASSECTRYQCDPSAHVCALLPRDEDGDGDPSPRCGGRDCDEHNAARVGDPANPIAQERCDGVDNDCDGVVDEGRWSQTAPHQVLTGFAAPSTLASARRDDGALALLAASGATTAALRFYDGSALGLTPLRYAAEVLVDGAPVTRADACPVRNAAGVADFGACNFADVVAAPMGGAPWFALTLNTAGCAAGQVRAGWFDPASGRVLLSSVGSTLAVGVDLTPAGCTGASRVPARPGASRVALASLTLDEANPRALGAWLAREPSTGGCAAASVEALGLAFTQEFRAGGQRIQSVRGTDEGRPRSLGLTLGDGRPAVVAVPTARAFAVAFGGDGGGVRVHMVPDFASPPGALDVSAAPFTLGTGGAATVSQVVAALGAASPQGFDLGLLWREGCEGDGPLRFSRVRVSATSPAMFSATSPIAVAARGRLPSIAYASSGLLATGAMRGATAVTDVNDGGWVLAWVEGNRAVGRRVSEVDGALIDEAEVTLGDARGDTRGVRLEVAPTSLGVRVLGLTHDAEGASLVGADLICRSP